MPAAAARPSLTYTQRAPFIQFAFLINCKLRSDRSQEWPCIARLTNGLQQNSNKLPEDCVSRRADIVELAMPPASHCGRVDKPHDRELLAF